MARSRKKKSLTIKKSSALIQTNARGLTLTQRKIINTFIYIAQQMGNQKRYSFPTAQLKKYCGITMKGNNDLKKQLKEMMEIIVEFNYLGKDKKWVWEATVLIPSVTIRQGSRYTEFEFTECLKEKILRPDIYAPLNIILIAGLSSTYAIVLYEFLKDYMTAPTVPALTIEQFRNLLGIDETKYQEFTDFRKWVLNKAVDEVNEKTDIRCSYTLTKEHGNRYSHISFTVTKNEKFKLPRPVHLPQDESSILPAGGDDIPHDVLQVIPEKYRVPEVFQIIAPYLDHQAMLISNIRYTSKKHKENFIAYLRKALQKDYARSAREVQENIERAEAEKEEQAMLEALERAEEAKRIEAVIAWREQAPPALLQQIRDRANREVQEEYPETGKNFLGIPVRIRTDEIIANEYLNKPQEPDQEELVLFEVEQGN